MNIFLYGRDNFIHCALRAIAEPVNISFIGRPGDAVRLINSDQQCAVIFDFTSMERYRQTFRFYLYLRGMRPDIPFLLLTTRRTRTDFFPGTPLCDVDDALDIATGMLRNFMHQVSMSPAPDSTGLVFSPGQVSVLFLRASGLSFLQIADILDINMKTACGYHYSCMKIMNIPRTRDFRHYGQYVVRYLLEKYPDIARPLARRAQVTEG